MDYRLINSKRQFKDATGYSKEKFVELVSDCEHTYLLRYGKTYEDYLNDDVIEEAKIKTVGDGVFLVLFHLKNGLVWGSLGAVFGMATSSVQSNFNTFFSIMEETLDKKK